MTKQMLQAKVKMLVFSFDIMLDIDGGRFFATMIIRIRKNEFINRYVTDKSVIADYVYDRYPSLRNRSWHIEENKDSIFESSFGKPTQIKN